MDQQQLHRLHPTFGQADAYEKIKRLLDFEAGQKLQILDVGSGNGLLGERLIKLGHEVVGLDINPQAGQKTWVKVCDISNLWPVEPDFFDIVICTDVAEHLYRPVHIFMEAKKVLKPSGRLIFGVPNHFDLRQRLTTLFGRGIVHWDNIKDRQEAADYAHIRFFILAELKKMFLGQGWKIVISQYNFMGGGIISARFTPKFFKIFLLKFWPGLFSGKFIFLLRPEAGGNYAEPAEIFVLNTPAGF